MAATTVDELQVLITANTSGLNSGLNSTKTQLNEMGATAGSAGEKLGSSIDSGSARATAAFDSFKSSAKIAFAAVTAGAVAITKTIVDSTGDYESSLSQLSYASGATSDQMNSMANEARQLGQDTSLAGVTAADAANSMVELSKAGLSVNDVMAAAPSVLALAKAGGIDFADAAVIAASALNAFKMKGADASKVADALAAGANASQADLSDLAEGLQQSATVASQFKLSLNDTVTSLALFANNGIKGSDAGTSLKTMLISLAKPSQEASDAMKKIGFNAYDAQGNFVGLREMSDRLSKSLSGLTEEQKQNVLATIFGTDAFRAASVLASNAGDSYDAMSKSVGQAGAATKAANSQLGPWQKALEGAQNTVSDFELKIGNKLLPTLTNLANSFSTNFIPATKNVYTVVSALSPVIAGITIAIGAYATAVKLAAIAHGAFIAATSITNPTLLAITSIVGLATVIGGYVAMSNGATTSTNALKTAQDNLKLATDSVSASEKSLSDARLARTGSDLAVEQAVRNYNDAVRQYGPASLEARTAEYNLQTARESQKDAIDKEKTALQQLKDEQKKKDDADAVASNEKKKQDAYRQTQSTIWDTINGMTSLEKKIQSSGSSAKINVSLSPFQHKATGGSVSAGTPYIVGDNPDGSINSTSELFVPNTSGTIINSSDLQGLLGNNTTKSVTTTNIFKINLSGIMASSASDEREIAKRLVERVNEELRANGKPQIGVA